MKKDSKYFSFIVDSTPGRISHVDQLTFTVRYVTETAEIAGRFLKFLAIHGHTAQSLFDVVQSTFKTLDIDRQLSWAVL